MNGVMLIVFSFVSAAAIVSLCLAIAMLARPRIELPGVDERTDDDFVPRGPAMGSVDELLQALRTRYRNPDTLDDPRYDQTAIENLRLLICVRSMQRWSDREVLAELLAIGLDVEYAEELIAATHAAGRIETLEIGTFVKYGRGLPAFWKNPTFEHRRLIAMRASHRVELARELAGLDTATPQAPPIELLEEPEVLPPTVSAGARRTDRRRAILSVAVAMLVLSAIALLLYLHD